MKLMRNEYNESETFYVDFEREWILVSLYKVNLNYRYTGNRD